MPLGDESIGDPITFFMLGIILPDILKLILKIPHFIIIKIGKIRSDVDAVVMDESL